MARGRGTPRVQGDSLPVSRAQQRRSSCAGTSRVEVEARVPGQVLSDEVLFSLQVSACSLLTPSPVDRTKFWEKSITCSLFARLLEPLSFGRHQAGSGDGVMQPGPALRARGQSVSDRMKGELVQQHFAGVFDVVGVKPWSYLCWI